MLRASGELSGAFGSNCPSGSANRARSRPVPARCS